MVLIIYAPAFSQTASRFLEEGNKAYKAKDYARAEAYYREAVQADPDSAGAYQGLGNCDLRLGKMAEALAQYEKALDLSPNSAPLSQIVGSLREKTSQSAGTAGFSPISVPSPPSDLSSRLEKQELDIETSHLQVNELREDTEADQKVERLQSAQKSGELAQAGQDQENLLILDWTNSEIWNKGDRYKIAQLENLARARGWPIQKALEKRAPDGHARWRCLIRNVSLTRYQNRDRGIFEMKAPSQPDDFKIETVEGLSFHSSAREVQSAFQNGYFTYEGEDSQANQKVLKFKHVRDLDFDDKFEISFDSSGKMTDVRYGVLDEH
jgi:tetratricopeptide (TPR) repeat protein